MRKKYIVLIVTFGVICLFLPFIINGCYDLGEKHPIINLRFSAGEMLSYIGSSIALLLSVFAIVLSLKCDDVNIQIHHAFTINENNKEALYIEIVNNSNFECEIQSFELANKNHRHFCKMIRKKPFTIGSKQSHSETIEIEKIKKYINAVSMGKSKVFYCIRTSTNQTIFLSSKALYKCMKAYEQNQQQIAKLHEGETDK